MIETTTPLLAAMAEHPLLDLLVKSVLLLTLAEALVHLARRQPAAVRSAIWCAAIVGLLLLPAIELGAPGFTVLSSQRPGPGPGLSAAQPIATGTAPVGAASTIRSPVRIQAADRSAHDGPPPNGAGGLLSTRTLGLVALRLWLLGAIPLLVWLGVEIVRIERLRHRASPITDPAWKEEWRRALDQLGLRKEPALLKVPDLKVPLLGGLLRSFVALPEDAPSWATGRRRAVLLHELAHLRRRDLWSSLAAELTRALYWPNPLAWRALQHQRLEAERACDEAVLAAGIEPETYARDLLAIAAGARGRFPLAPALARRRSLGLRLETILDRSPQSPARRLRVAAVVVALSLAVATVGLSRVGIADSGASAPLLAALEDPDPVVRRRAAWGLGESEEEAAAGRLHRLLGDPDSEVRMMAAWALGEIKERGSVEPLMASLDEPDPLVREMMIKALGEIESPRAVPRLSAIAGDPAAAADLRSAALWSLGEIGTASALSAVHRELGAQSPRVRLAAVRALCPRASRRVTEALVSALEDPDLEVRVAAARHLGESHRTEAIAGLIGALDGAEPALRAEAAHSLGRLRSPLGVEPLIDRLRDASPEVRDAATWALDEIGL